MKKQILYLLAFLIKGWEVSLLLILPILKTQDKISVYQVGILAGIFAIFQIFASLFSGTLAEKFGRKKMMMAAVFFYSLGWSLLIFPINIFLLIIVYGLGGMGTGSFIPLANSQIARLSVKNRAKEMGDFSAFTDIGRIILTAITTFLIGSFNIAITALLFAILAIISTISLLKINLLVEPVQHTTTLQNVNLKDFLKIKRFIYSVLSGVFDVFASSSLFIFIPLLLMPKGISISSVGLLSALFFGGYLAGRVFLGRLADKYGAVKILVFSEISMALLILCLIFLNNFFLISITLFILGIFTRGTSPVIRTMMANSVSHEAKFDKAFSLHSFTLSTAQVASRSVYGFTAGLFGITSVFYLSAFVAVATLLPLYLYNKLHDE